MESSSMLSNTLATATTAALYVMEHQTHVKQGILNIENVKELFYVLISSSLKDENQNLRVHIFKNIFCYQ